MMKTKVVGITGQAQCGKDTFAAFLAPARYSTYVLAFADPLKRAVSEAFGIPLREVLSPQFKTKVHLPWGLNGREILEKFGTESMRDVFCQDFWIKRMDQRVRVHTSMDELVIVTDVRFEDEAAYVRERGILVHLDRPGMEPISNGVPNHRSRTGVVKLPQDLSITNTTLDELRSAAVALMGSLK